MYLRGFFMSSNESCSSCQHLVASQMSSAPWCRLRRISVDNDLAKYALCHHWTGRNPSLPKIKTEEIEAIDMDLQLELGKNLTEINDFAND